jgi:alkylation response protein AidB-like acyl-CoA dehydrogenase
VDFTVDRSERQFRQEVRAFLASDLPADMARRALSGFLFAEQDTRAWQRILDRRGWSVAHWPVQFGGTGWPARKLQIFEEECFLAGAPPQNASAVHLVGPVIYTFGTDEQKSRFLPGIRSGETFWIQGFSEPGSGSDLASLRTSAVRDGGYYVVNGQKIWTSYAQYGDWNFILARTRAEGKPQEGISFLLLDTKSPGVTIRPIQTIEGSHHLAEVFYDNVRVPLENLVGEENQGWTYTKFLLFSERAFTSAEVPALKRYLHRIKQLAGRIHSGDTVLLNDPEFSSRLARLELEVLAVEMTASRVLSQGISDHNGGKIIGSILKVRGTELSQKLTDLLAEMLGDHAAYFYPDTSENSTVRDARFPGPAHAPGIVADLIYRRASSIFGGTNEIQRNLIAKDLLHY